MHKMNNHFGRQHEQQNVHSHVEGAVILHTQNALCNKRSCTYGVSENQERRNYREELAQVDKENCGNNNNINRHHSFVMLFGQQGVSALKQFGVERGIDQRASLILYVFIDCILHFLVEV